MTQYFFGDLSSPLPGSTFIDDNLEPWAAALHSMHSGVSRPSYVQTGMMWLDISSTPWQIKVFQGTDDMVVSSLDPSTLAVTSPIPDGSITTQKINDGAVTNEKLANMGSNTIKCRTGTDGDPLDLLVGQNSLIARPTGDALQSVQLGSGLSLSAGNIDTSSVITSGVYTPTFSNEVGISGSVSSGLSWRWERISVKGVSSDTVIVRAGNFSFTCDNGSSSSGADFTLPFPISSTNTGALCGTLGNVASTSSQLRLGTFNGLGSGAGGRFRVTNSTGGSTTYVGTFIYAATST